MVIAAVGAVLSIFHIYTGFFGLYTAERQRSIHLMLALIIVFIKYSWKKGSKESSPIWFDYILIAMSILSCSYMAVNVEQILARAGDETTIDLIMGALLLIPLLEATRRTIGNVLTGLGIIMLLYCRFGYLFPGILWHPGFRLNTIIRHMYLTGNGIWSTPLGVSASYIAMFILFGAALRETGLAELLLKIAKGIFAGMIGGPAKMGVVASSAFAMISGSSTSNVATTGIITIPLMKSTGVPSHFAAAVEAAASLGGQITPPVMGAVAFIMSEYLGISYLKVCLAAALPALLYYVCVFSVIHFESCKMGARGIPKSNDTSWKKEVIRKGYRAIPVFSLVILLMKGRSPIVASMLFFVGTDR